MRVPPPSDLDLDAVSAALADNWDIRLRRFDYLPVGGGGYHWHATDGAGGDFFVTVDDLDTKAWLGDDRDSVAEGLVAALDTAQCLRSSDLSFVVAPLCARDGRPAIRLGDRYAISVYVHLEGRSYPFGFQPEPTVRERALDLLIALHLSDAPTGIPRHVHPSIGARLDLDAFLREPTEPWSGGRLSEQARSVLAPCAEMLAQRLAAFDRAAQSVPDSIVVTHGEPHGGNLMSIGDDLMLIDWDTVGLAAPERDLWLLDLDDAFARRYAEATGHTPDRALLALYRERWLFDDIAQSVRYFRGAHDADADHSLLALPALLDALSTRPRS